MNKQKKNPILFRKNSGFLFFLLTCFRDYSQFSYVGFDRFSEIQIWYFFFFVLFRNVCENIYFFWFNNHFDFDFFELDSQKKTNQMQFINWMFSVELTYDWHILKSIEFIC